MHRGEASLHAQRPVAGLRRHLSDLPECHRELLPGCYCGMRSRCQSCSAARGRPYLEPSMVPRERVKRERRASWLDIRSEGKSAAVPATVSGAPLVRPPITKGGSLSRMVREDRARDIGVTAPNVVSQETCHRRANHAAGRGAPEDGDNYVCHLWRRLPSLGRIVPRFT
jgi:hypothetical protein